MPVVVLLQTQKLQEENTLYKEPGKTGKQIDTEAGISAGSQQQWISSRYRNEQMGWKRMELRFCRM